MGFLKIYLWTTTVPCVARNIWNHFGPRNDLNKLHAHLPEICNMHCLLGSVWSKLVSCRKDSWVNHTNSQTILKHVLFGDVIWNTVHGSDEVGSWSHYKTRFHTCWVVGWLFEISGASTVLHNFSATTADWRMLQLVSSLAALQGTLELESSYHTSRHTVDVDGSNPAKKQLRLLVYPFIYRVLGHIPGGCLGFLPSTVRKQHRENRRPWHGTRSD